MKNKNNKIQYILAQNLNTSYRRSRNLHAVKHAHAVYEWPSNFGFAFAGTLPSNHILLQFTYLMGNGRWPLQTLTDTLSNQASTRHNRDTVRHHRNRATHKPSQDTHLSNQAIRQRSHSTSLTRKGGGGGGGGGRGFFFRQEGNPPPPLFFFWWLWLREHVAIVHEYNPSPWAPSAAFCEALIRFNFLHCPHIDMNASPPSLPILLCSLVLNYLTGTHRSQDMGHQHRSQGKCRRLGQSYLPCTTLFVSVDIWSTHCFFSGCLFPGLFSTPLLSTLFFECISPSLLLPASYPSLLPLGLLSPIQITAKLT